MSCLPGFDLESNHLDDTHIKLNMCTIKIVMRAVLSVLVIVDGTAKHS